MIRQRKVHAEISKVHLDRKKKLVAILIVERRREYVVEIRQNIHSIRGIQVLEWQREWVIIAQFCHDSLEGIHIQSMKQEEHPRIMNVDLLSGGLGLDIATIAIHAMNLCLLVEVSGVVARQLLHRLDCVLELCNVSSVQLMRLLMDLYGEGIGNQFNQMRNSSNQRFFDCINFDKFQQEQTKAQIKGNDDFPLV